MSDELPNPVGCRPKGTKAVIPAKSLGQINWELNEELRAPVTVIDAIERLAKAHPTFFGAPAAK